MTGCRPSEAGAGSGHLTGVVSLGEGFEQASLILDADTDAAVLHGEMHMQLLWIRRVGGLQTDLHLPAAGKFDRVADQVRQDLLEPQRVDQHVGVDPAVQFQHQVEVFLARQAVEHPHH